MNSTRDDENDQHENPTSKLKLNLFFEFLTVLVRSIMQQPEDAAFDGQHYLPWTLRTTPRDPIPDKNQLDPNWAVHCQDQKEPLWSLKTPSGLPFSLVSSCMQGSLRQSKILESIQWTLEMLATDAHLDGFSGQDPVTRIITTRKVGKGESNLLHRQMIISVEDIGLSNPCMVVEMAKIIREKPAYAIYIDVQRAYINTAILLASSVKSRSVDWACIARINVPEPFDITLYYNKLIENLMSGNHVLAVGYAEQFISESLKDKEAKLKDPVPKHLFDQLSHGATSRGKPLKFYKNKRQVMWAAIMRVAAYLNSPEGISANQGKRYPVVTEIVESCYDLAHDDAFRWKVEARLFGRMALLSLALRDAVEARGLAFRSVPMEEFPNGRQFTYDEIEQLRLSHRNSNLWYGIPELCKDKHTSYGKQLGRNIQHFIEVKAFLRHEDPALIELSDYWLNLCFQTRYNCGGQFDRSGMIIEKYIEWLPELRKRFNILNKIEDAILKSTITITWSECVENHQGMQKIGQLASEGFSCAELMQIGQNFVAAEIQAEIYDLRDGLNGILGADGQELKPTAPEASILILRNATNRFVTTNNEASLKLKGADAVLLELLNLTWDSKMFSRKHKKVSPDGTVLKDGVVSKKKRHNLCFADFNQEPDYANGKGRLYAFDDVPGLKSIREKLEQCFGPRAHNLLAEGNYYFDKNTCSISMHGDVERRIVIGFRFGATMSLQYQWYMQSKPVGIEMCFMLNHGDVYLMSNFSTGFNWMTKKTPTLRHAANSGAGKK